jgi:hypothetical protein
MQIEIFALCQSAKFDGTNLSVSGIFDTIGAKAFPAKMSWSVPVKIRFELGEEGERKLEIILVNAYMRPVTVDGTIARFEENIQIQIPNSRSSSYFHIWDYQGFSIEKAGDYFFELNVDGQTKGRIPFYIWQSS